MLIWAQNILGLFKPMNFAGLVWAQNIFNAQNSSLENDYKPGAKLASSVPGQARTDLQNFSALYEHKD